MGKWPLQPMFCERWFPFIFFFFFFFLPKVSLREEPEKDFGMMLVLPGLGKQANSLTGS